MQKEKILLELKKKILTIGLITTTSVTTLTGCGVEPIFKYVTQEDGSINLAKSIPHSSIENCNIIVLLYNDETIQFYISREKSYASFDKKTINYLDIKTGKELKVDLHNSENINELNNIEEYDLIEYLTKIDFIKEFYIEEDFNYILEEFEKDYEESLKLSKTKE